jgi:Carboxypeptidase regulatory-like domain
MFSRRTSLPRMAWLLCILLAAALPAGAQIVTGTVTGTLKDTSGAIVPGAAVTLISETRGTQVSDVFTNDSGDFTFANVSPDRYTLQITMGGFKTLKRTGMIVSAGDRTSIGTLSIEIGGLTDIVQVKAEAPLVQSSSGERSFTVSRESVENLPIANRSFTGLAFLAPGVTLDNNNTPVRVGGGGDPNIMMDGVSTMDTGSNRPLLQMNVESIAEVKILTSTYQAEYGRASGVQVTAVTKSGTNQFRGSAYDVQRDSKWNSNSKVNVLNGDPKTILKEKDLGFTLGGPIGKPGGTNKLFFFYAQEFSPRTKGGLITNYRVPTALERAGDFSQTLDNNGLPYPYIKDPSSSAGCSATNTAGCFQDGGVIGKIPQNQLYQPGLNILKLWPTPTQDGAGLGYNYRVTAPKESILSWQPAFRFDYNVIPNLRATFKYSAWWQADHTFTGTIPGFNDTKMQHAPVSSYTTSVNYTLNNTTFLEATYGHSQNELAGCAQAQTGTGAIFCNNGAGAQGIPTGDAASFAGAGLQGLPLIFPNATVLNPDYYAVKALNQLNPAFWDGARMSKIPTFQWGNRVANAPPNLGFPGWFNINSTQDFAISVTKVMGRHTAKTGFYVTHSFKAEQTSNNAFGVINFQQDAVGTNQFDTSFGFANAAIGSFSTYTQAQKYVETASLYNNLDAYIQDNWKLNSRLTLDYGIRFVHQGVQYDQLSQASNFLPNQWTLATAPALYTAGCLGAAPCSGSNRVAVNPITGANLGANSSVAIGTLVPGTGNRLNGLVLPGGDVPKGLFKWPMIAPAPRFGMAYDITGKQAIVVRGGAGIFYDRPFTTTLSGGVNNPPTSATVVAQYAQLQNLGGAGLTIAGAPGLAAIKFDDQLPTSAQWNGGMQFALPWATSLDVSYTGQHKYHAFQGVNLNAVDFGAAFAPANQDPTLAASTTPGATAVTTNLLRAYKGYAAITQQWDRAWRTSHTIQWSLQRRFRNGLAFGFNDTMGLSDKQSAGLRLQHNADGSFDIRADQAQADELLGQNNPVGHLFRGNFVWDLPDLKSSNPALRAIGYAVNDWQVSGIWSGQRIGVNVTEGNSGVASDAYTVGFSYANGGGNVNLTGSPDYGARIRVVGDPGTGCSKDLTRQFNTSAFQGPATGSVGLESGNSYLTGCFISTLDLAIARNIRLGGARNFQLRLDMFNALNAAGITGRNTTLNLVNPSDPITGTNLPYDPVTGAAVAARLIPRGAGFGVANAFQAPRTMQVQLRFSF